MLAVVAGYRLFVIAYALGHPMNRPPLDPRSLIWILPWSTGLTVISYLRQYSGTKRLPEGIDLALAADELEQPPTPNSRLHDTRCAVAIPSRSDTDETNVSRYGLSRLGHHWSVSSGTARRDGHRWSDCPARV